MYILWIGLEEVQPPELIKPLEDVEVLEGTAARLECSFAHAADATVTWYKDEEPLNDDSERLTMKFDGEVCALTIPDAMLDDEGDYKCEVSNQYGAASSSVELVVEEGLSLPVFSKGLEKCEVVQGETVSFDVCVSGQPDPIVEWFKDGKQLEDEGRFIIIDDVDDTKPELFSMVIEDCLPIDTGDYKCVAMNEAGKAYSTGGLVVLPSGGM